MVCPSISDYLECKYEIGRIGSKSYVTNHIRTASPYCRASYKTVQRRSDT